MIHRNLPLSGGIIPVPVWCFWIVLTFFAAFPVRAESRGISRKNGAPSFSANAHKGPVKVLLHDHQGRILSAGEDGFLGVWDISANAAVERFQLSPFSITSMILRPDKPEIALIEQNVSGHYRISAWNYETQTRLFVRSYNVPVSFIVYSGSGNFLITAQNGRSGVSFLNAETGNDMSVPLNLQGAVSFAATGRSERTMIAYVPSGTLSYWELESGNEIRRLSVPPNLRSPLLIGNNTFLAGFDSGGLVIINALSGDIIARDLSGPAGLLVPVAAEPQEFMGFFTDRIRYYSFTPRDGLQRTKELAVSVTGGVTCVLSAGQTPFLGSADGRVRSFDPRGNIRAMIAERQIPLRDAAASGGVLAFIAEADDLGFLPLDYRALENQGLIRLEDARNYTNIAADPGADPEGPGKFLFWRPDGGEYPALRTVPELGRPVQNVPGDIIKEPGKNPLSVSIFTDRILYLDTGGNITVSSPGWEDALFSFFSPGAQDAAFLDPENIIIGRSTGSGGSPFLKVNLSSGETVPLTYPADVGVRVYRGVRGAIYGEATALVSGGVKTGIIKLDTTRPDHFEVLTEYQGDETGFEIADCNGTLASTLGDDGAFIYGSGGAVPFERTPGLPIKLIGGLEHFIAIDQDGGISWHDPRTGACLALLRLYKTQWFLEKADGSFLTGSVKKDP